MADWKKACVMEAVFRKAVGGTHVNDHADRGESGSQVLWVGRPHRHRDDPRVETAIEGSYKVNACRDNRKTWAVGTETRRDVRDEMSVMCVFLPGG